ncbi:unnamed protein product, partial [Phaeothamnion confervicola]
DLAGTPKLGDRWIISLAGVQYVVTVDAVITTLGNNALAGIGARLAAAINAGAPDSFSAFMVGNTLYVTERTGAAFDSAAVVGLATSANGTILAAAPGSAISVALSGDPAAGDIWRLTINGTQHNVTIGSVLGSADYTFATGVVLPAGSPPIVIDTPAEVALALAAAVNRLAANSASPAADKDLLATAVGDALVL